MITVENVIRKNAVENSSAEQPEKKKLINFRKPLPWIIIGIVVVGVGYWLYKKNKKASETGI